ncbi:carbamoyl-phosphate synthase small subunit [Desulfosalsimonas propionicica]|uniref:Carbamoyl phosphate synthase small chain n=1 Tax=Desulfosalsimonas propionicica TaxID=332175 RepID=A0A7W0C755_9BACT|nr:glutamine-hydrolyzing carbamoyl-phosphate synthase small subunit [Desulfosalsimonas propionicica]MBA2880377.1 carbamoyl-phosphate synthase small subunit [Desulfosalsimonas propionicica]
MKALLALEDGRAFACRSFTGPGEASGEMVFNTGMTGYQEILTDPSYRGQMVTMTYPLVGNYGVNAEDIESDRVQVGAFVIREYQDQYSNFRADQSLADYLRAHGVMGVDELDTRALTRHIRQAGAMRAFVSTHDTDPQSLSARARQIPPMEGQDLVCHVTAKKPYFWKNNRPVACDVSGPDQRFWGPKTDGFRVVALDYGVKYNILRCLENAGCQVLVLPADTPADAVKKLDPDGVFLSNGPGDPAPLSYAVETARQLIGYKPMFGICLGIQLLGQALGAKTFKLKFGHHGVNQPVQHLATGKVEITSQNHGFAVDPDTLDAKAVDITHMNLNDQTLEGFSHRQYPLFTVQYHPEAAPGPHDAGYLFNDFVRMIRDNQ